MSEEKIKIKEEVIDKMSVDDAINAIKKVYDIRLEECPIRTKHLSEALSETFKT